MIRYVVVALGDLETPAEQEDCEVVASLIERLGFKATILSERTCRVLTTHLVTTMTRDGGLT